jgi:hypothetical protein
VLALALDVKLTVGDWETAELAEGVGEDVVVDVDVGEPSALVGVMLGVVVPEGEREDVLEGVPEGVAVGESVPLGDCVCAWMATASRQSIRQERAMMGIRRTMALPRAFDNGMGEFGAR